MKQCTKCKQFLDNSEFHKDRTRRDGLQIQCKECRKQYVYPVAWRAYRESHREERRAYQKIYDAAHPLSLDQRREKHNRYKAQDPVAFKAADRARTERHRARKAALPATLTEQEWQFILYHFSHSCAYCGNNDKPLQQEHIIPVFQGGGYTRENIVPACPDCNKRKGARTPEEAGMSILKIAVMPDHELTW